MERDFRVNAAGPARLFRAVWPVMEASSSSSADDGEGNKKEKKFVLITSTLGSIGLLDKEMMPGVAYGMSKVAANWFARKVSVELKGRLVVGVLHPG
jgi:NAD(P)-dependent dehydrogenase (short-subunit alcohol dehydrogenase family)